MSPELYFDRQDREILTMVNRILECPDKAQSRVFDANLHPHGIKGLVISRVSRVAYAVINLLTNLEVGQADDRLMALQALYDEVMSSAHSMLRRNTARVLLQIMKDLVRAQDSPLTQLKLAHDFRKAAQGTPRVVRKMLARYHLPEMPEEWNQLSFDDHVYDAHSRGRKTPTHLIMDAWIKGLRYLTVVYSHYIDYAAAKEILDAAAIMGIHVRVGLEFRCPFRGRYVSMVWVPRGFSAAADFLEFLETEKMQGLIREGHDAVAWRRERTLEALERWNAQRRPGLEKAWKVEIPALKPERFMACVGLGQPSFEHLAECIHNHVLPFMRLRAENLRARISSGEDTEGAAAKELLELDSLTGTAVASAWLEGSDLPEIGREKEGVPAMLTRSPSEMVELLTSMHTGYRLILNLAGLNVRDVLELLYDCDCCITHLELFNLKDWHEGLLNDLPAVNELQRVLNEGRGPRIKQIVHEILDSLEAAGEKERAAKFRSIQSNIPILWEYYRKNPLKSRIGSNSVRNSGNRSFGMGFVYTETLPKRAKKTLRENSAYMGEIPVYTRIEERISYEDDKENVSGFTRAVRRVPGFRHFRQARNRAWLPDDNSQVMRPGNVVSLGGINRPRANGLMEEKAPPKEDKPGSSYLSTTVTNWIKVMAGFIPSVASFLYTQDWWFLAWFGTFIWFGITGIRNIIQMVVAGNGTTRNTLLRWKDHVSISRICDSLMYTGISVALLEVVVRVWLLEDMCGLSVREYPGIVFTVLNFVNAIYICAHNIYRGFPREAAIGNLFRSALAIPVSSWYNQAFVAILLLCGVADPLFYTVPSAAIISKLASDTVAAVIEGYADSQNNRRMRRWDYEGKVARVFSCYTRLELLFPEEDILIKLARSEGRMEGEARKLELALIINALDLMYFWFYQPRAQDAFRRMVRGMSQADRTVFARSQLVLLRERDISQLFVDGLVGRNFSQPLAFYLDRRRDYLNAMMKLCRPGRKNVQPLPVIRFEGSAAAPHGQAGDNAE
ncbi:hypothetical protein [Mailhella massiliensis]|uniref:Uncharacterized protein n=1 Tax=Mailhella massiliensis TaxID=1903261 RepID=A0A921AWB0_9BACT|nr:hypothetical protein [Mailhella massiliensis]HJD96943.1 hypothetical protein [Mailhella massiliensis]